MQVPVEKSFRGLTGAEVEAAQKLIDEQVAKIDSIASDAISCRIAVSRPQEHQRSGSAYRARIRLTLSPHKELVVTKEPGDNDSRADVRAVLHSAFDALHRQLVTARQKRRNHEPVTREPVGFVVKLFSESGYGFIKTPDGEEIYFHRNSVAHHDFDRIRIGTQVRYVAVIGDDGLQASTVDIIDKPGDRREEGGPSESYVPDSWKP